MSAGLDFISKRRLHARPEHEADISRICSVPIQYPISDDEFEAVNLMEIKPEAYEHGFRLLRGQAEALLSFRERNGIFAPLKVGAGKCVCGDVEVFDRASGRRRQMREVADSLVLDSLDDELRFQPRLSRSFASGIKPCVRVELASGASIGLSTDHPVRTHLGWVRAEDLTREHLIATPRKLEPGPGVQASDAEIKLIAYLLADGCLRNASVSFCDEPGETVDDVLRCCKELGFSTTVVPERSKAVSVNIRGALEWTRKWGLQEVLSRNKRVPATLYSMGAYQTRLFLGCFWACDGHSNTRSLECTLASEGLLRDLKHLMLYLGICCSIHYKKATIGRKVYDAWRMSISGQDAITFLQEVDVVGQIDKNAKILSAMRCKKRNPNTDVVPIGYEHAGELSTQSGLTPTTIKRKLGLTIGQRISRQAYSHFCHEHLIDDPLATSDLRWVKLKRVVPIGNREVFDASVDEDHNFVANGVVVHNTLVSLRCIAIAMEQGLERCALFVPPQVHEQLVDRDIAWVRRRVELGLTFYPMGGKSPQQRMALAGGRRGCWIFPYSLLSTRDASELLEKIRPQLMVFDEAHMLKHRNSARTKRVWSYWKKHRPQVVALSGTMTSKSLREFAHHIVGQAKLAGDGRHIEVSHT